MATKVKGLLKGLRYISQIFGEGMIIDSIAIFMFFPPLLFLFVGNDLIY